jgi:hypothetical protein
MSKRGWFLLPRREGQQVQRAHTLKHPLVERIQRMTRAAGATEAPRSAGSKKWFENPRRSK